MRVANYRTVRIDVRENDTIYLVPEGDDIYNSDDMLSILAEMEKLSDGKRFKLLMLLGGTEFLMTKDARETFKANQIAKELIIAEAVVMKSRSTTILYNLLTKLYAPPFPFKAFSSEKKALLWLAEQQDR